MRDALRERIECKLPDATARTQSPPVNMKKSNRRSRQKVFVVGCQQCRFAELSGKEIEWNVPVAADEGDLVLMYRARPASAIHDAWRITGPSTKYPKGNPHDRYPGLQAPMRRIATFKKPLTFAMLASDHQTAALPLVRKRCQGKTNVTVSWPILFRRLVKLHPGAKLPLQKFLHH